MTASGTATVPERAEFESETPTATLRFFNRLGLILLIAGAPASIVYLSFNQGGFFPNSTGLAAIGFAAALVLRTTLAEHPFAGYNRQLAVLLLALAFFALWQLASALWSHDLARALDEYDRTLLYLLAFALFGSLPRSPARLRWLIRALAAGVTAVCLAGLLSRVPPPPLADGHELLRQPAELPAHLLERRRTPGGGGLDPVDSSRLKRGRASGRARPRGDLRPRHSGNSPVDLLQGCSRGRDHRSGRLSPGRSTPGHIGSPCGPHTNHGNRPAC